MRGAAIGSSWLHHGELVAVCVPTPTEEAVRRLVPRLGRQHTDRTRVRHRLSKFLRRHGGVWRGGTTSRMLAQERSLLGEQLDEPALAAVTRIPGGSAKSGRVAGRDRGGPCRLV